MKGLRHTIDNIVQDEMGLNLTNQTLSRILEACKVKEIQAVTCPDGSIYGLHRTKEGSEQSKVILNNRYGGYKSMTIKVED